MRSHHPISHAGRALRRTLSAVAAVATLLLGTQAAQAVDPTYLRIPTRAMGITRSVSVPVDKSMIIDLPTNVGEVIVGAPSIATVIMRTKSRAIIQGVTGGNTNILFLDPAGNNVAVIDLNVFQQRSDVANALEAAIARNIAGSRVRVESVTLDGTTNRVVLSGTVLSQDDLDKAMAMAKQFAGGDDNVASIVTVRGNQQVMLRVVVAEVDRTVVKQLGLDLNVSASGGLTTGLVNSPNLALGGASGVSGGEGTITASANLGPLSIDATLKALARRNAVRTLAEPTLTAMSGETADFLAGGQRAINVLDANGNTVTTYKDYGVKLGFTPTVKSNGSIALKVSTEVSQPNGADFLTRSADTTVEIPAGCTLSIGGLIQDTWKHQISGMPGLGDIPILGALFRSRDFIHDQTELVIMVTPVLAQLGRPDLPTDHMQMAGDAEAIFLGHMEKMYGVGNDGMRGSYSGSVGFMLD